MNFRLQVISELDSIRDMNSDKHSRLKAEIYKKIPELHKIDLELMDISVALVNNLFNGDEDVMALAEHLKIVSNKLMQEKTALLIKNGYTKDSLNMIYTCENCKDTGFIAGTMCKCFKQKLADKYYKYSNLSNLMYENNFDTFDIDKFRDEIDFDYNISPREMASKNLEWARQFVKDFNIKKTINLYMTGGVGRGKTFLCSCIAKSIIDNGYSVIYKSANDLFDSIRMDKFVDFSSSESNNENYQILLDVDLLIIDDLGAESTTNFTTAELFNILNSRIVNNKKNIISSNLAPYELVEKYGERISSRIYGNFKILEFIGDDLRMPRIS